MELDTVRRKIVDILVDEFELDPASIVPEARLRDDLELDSLDGIDLILAVEKTFGVRLDDRRLLQLETVGEVEAYLMEALRAVPEQTS